MRAARAALPRDSWAAYAAAWLFIRARCTHPLRSGEQSAGSGSSTHQNIASGFAPRPIGSKPRSPACRGGCSDARISQQDLSRDILAIAIFYS